MNCIVHHTYFPCVAQFSAMLEADLVTFEMNDNYQKQTYRNRSYIYGANGKLQLSIPVVFSQKERQLYRDIKIHNTENWQIHHWKSLQSAYKTSPFFEFYEDDLQPLFKQEISYLLDFNKICLEIILDCLQIDLKVAETKNYDKIIFNQTDFRNLVNSRKEPNFNFDYYRQVFVDKHGFISNLSILDVLFNEGPNTVTYLKNQYKHL